MADAAPASKGARSSRLAFITILLLGGLLLRPGAAPTPSATMPAGGQEDQDAEAPSAEAPSFLRAASRFLTADHQAISGEQLLQEAARAGYEVEFLVATVPDPLESQVGWLFDGFLGAIRRGAEAHRFVMDRFFLPWNEEPGEDTGTPGLARHQREPGILLFRKEERRPAQGGAGAADPVRKLLVVLLVGETPTTGVHKQAFLGALDAAVSSPAGTQAPSRIRILGPTFSGSVPSIQLSLCEWLPGRTGPGKPPLEIRFVSGSATRFRNKADLENPHCSSKTPQGGPVPAEGQTITFHATVHPDADAFARFLAFLKERQHCDRIATLVESNTSYGQSVAPESRSKRMAAAPSVTGGTPATGETPATAEAPATDRPKECVIGKIPYPAHISRLRSAYEAEGRIGHAADDLPGSSRGSIRPDLQERRRRMDALPAMSPVATARAAEQELRGILDAVSREHRDYVGLLATNVRDKVFLAQELYNHFPDVRFFTLESDLLLAHPEFRPYLLGSLVISSYPLNMNSQQWTWPFRSDRWLQFSNSGAQGLYNATVALLAVDPRPHHGDGGAGSDGAPGAGPRWQAELVDYGPPLALDPLDPASGRGSPQTPTRPAVWLSVVARNGLWPLRVLEPAAEAEHPQSALDDYVLAVELPEPTPLRVPRLIALPRYMLVVVLLLLLSVVPPARWLLRTARGEENSSKRARRPTRAVAELASFYVLLVFQLFLLFVLIAPLARLADLGHVHPAARVGAWICGLAAVLTSTALVWIAIRFLRGSEGGRAAVAREPGDSNPFWRRTAPLVGALLVVLALVPASFLLAFAWKLAGPDRTDVLFSLQRMVFLANGVSPLVPIGLLLLAFYLFALCHWRRERLLEAFDLPTEMQMVGERAIGSLGNLGRRVQSAFRMAPPIGPVMILVPFLAVIAIVLNQHRNLVTLEGPLFDGFIITAFVMMFLYLALMVFRTARVWFGLRDFLLRLENHPFIRVYEHSPARVAANLSRRIMAPVPRLLDMGDAFQRLLLIQAGFKKLELTLPSQLGNLKSLSPRLNEVIDSAPKLDRGYQDELGASRERGGGFDLAASKAYAQIRDVAGVMYQVMATVWQTVGAPDGSQAREKDEKKHSIFWVARTHAEWLTQVGNLVAIFPANLVRHGMCHLRNSLAFICAGSLLMLGAMMNYPFQPRRLLLLVSGALIVAAAGVTLYVLSSIDRNPVISRMAGTKPGAITWDRTFIGNVLVLVALPILGLIGAQFPALTRDLLGFLAPLLRILG